jgi:hypothetical protein
MSFEMDEGTRPSLGVVVSLLDRGDGQSRIIMDDVRSQSLVRATAWVFDAFHTHKSHDNAALDNMSLSDDEYRDIGISLVARLLALNHRVKWSDEGRERR